MSFGSNKTAPILIVTHAPVTDVVDTVNAAGYQTYTVPKLPTKDEISEVGYFLAVILDLADDLPAMVELALALRRNPQFAGSPILAVTPNASNARQRLLDAGVDDLLTAPLDGVELLHRIRNCPRQFTEVGDFDALGHDLKGPLGTIIASLGLLTEMFPGEDESVQRLMEDSVRAAQRQNGLIENLVDYTRGLKNDMLIERDWYPASQIIREFLEASEAHIQRKGLIWNYEISPELPDVYTDLKVFRRVLDALLDNALKFCTRNNEVFFSTAVDHEYLYLRMQDNGRPIMPEYMDSIFDPAIQFKMRNAGSRTSIAWNLPFARVAARLMGGNLSASTEDSWTVFTLSISIQP